MAPRVGSLQRLLLAQAKELRGLEEGEIRDAFRLYRALRLDLFDRLDFLEDPAARLTPARFGRAANEIDAALGALRKGFVGQLKGAVRPIADLSKKHLIEQLAAMARWFPGTARPFTAPIGEPTELAIKLLVPQFDSVVGGYSEKIATDLRQRLAVSLQAGEDVTAARRRIFAGYLPPIRADQEEPVVAYWAKKIVTDQTTRTRGTVKLELVAAGETKGKLQKRWCSVLDDRTSDICEEMDGTVVDIDEPFTLPNGDQVMSPPGHRNCRADVIPWTEDWAPSIEPAPESEAEAA